MKHSSQALSKKLMAGWKRVTTPEGKRVWSDGSDAFDTKREVLDFIAGKNKSVFLEPAAPEAAPAETTNEVAVVTEPVQAPEVESVQE